MRNLFNRLANVLMPNPFERNGVSSLLLEHTQRISESMRRLRLQWHDPTGVAMVQRGAETHRLYKAYAGVLSAQSVSCTQTTQKRGGKQVRSDNMFSLKELSEVFASKQSLAAFVGATAQGPAAPARTLSVHSAPTFAAMSPNDHANPVLPESTLDPSCPCAAAFQNQVATTPGQHGVPFESSPRSQPVTPQPPSYPPADAPRDAIVRHLRTNNMCFARAFSGKCQRVRCSYSHDTVPAGFYRAVSREKGGAPPRQVVASLSEAAYEFAVEMGLVDMEDRGEFGASADGV
ncbi:unnamed protein product, partial [Scytosiphon promiscuus]